MTLNFVATVFLVFPEVAKVNPPFKSQISYFVMPRHELPTTSVCNSRVDHQLAMLLRFIHRLCGLRLLDIYFNLINLNRPFTSGSGGIMYHSKTNLSLSLSHFRSLRPCIHICMITRDTEVTEMGLTPTHTQNTTMAMTSIYAVLEIIHFRAIIHYCLI